MLAFETKAFYGLGIYGKQMTILRVVSFESSIFAA
jgi:hypothetical protein